MVAVDGVSFDVSEGEIFGLLGPHGAGKTTTVEHLRGLRRPDAGHIRVLGLDPQVETQALRRRAGSQLQEWALPDRIRVWEALDLFASFASDSRDWPTLNWWSPECYWLPPDLWPSRAGGNKTWILVTKSP